MTRVYFYGLFTLALLGLAPTLDAQRIQQRVDAFVRQNALLHASVGIDVMDLETGERVASHDPNRALIPASTQKLITTGVALDILGKDARFTTRLAIVGTVDKGTLSGDVYIIGGGDPTLASPKLKGVKRASVILTDWVAALKEAGIERIEGAVIAEDGYFGTAGIAADWPWYDIGNYYGAGSYGLNWHENYYHLDFIQRQRRGSTPSIQRTRPFVPGLRLHNELRTGAPGSGDNAYIYGAPFNYDNFVRGTIPPGNGRFTIKGSLPDPPLFVAQQLTNSLREAGVVVSLPAASSRSLGSSYAGNGRVVHTLDSPSLSTVVDRTNLRSLNLYAETLLREINKSRGVPDHELSGTDFIVEHLRTELGLDVSSLNLEDGSGLATRNFFAPAFMTAYLRSRVGDATFLRSIPLAGSTGSMRNRLKGTAAAGRLYAKSGSVNAVRCYAGYAFPTNGKRYVFAFMVNNYVTDGSKVNRLLLDLMLELCK